MGSFALYAENKVLDHVVGKASFTMPTVYLALFTVTPTHEDGTGGTEASLGNYARKVTAAANWAAAASGAIENAQDISFAECSGAGWGTINAFAGYDALTGGNMLFWGALGTPKTIGIGDTAKFAAGALDITLD